MRISNEQVQEWARNAPMSDSVIDGDNMPDNKVLGLHRLARDLLDARRERDEARVFVGALLGVIENDGERVASATELLGIETREELLAAAQGEIAK